MLCHYLFDTDLHQTYSFIQKMDEKHLSKQAVPITYTLEKELFAVATFESL